MKYQPKVIRQLLLYENISTTVYHGPEDLIHRFGISKRTLQRDLKDLRDSGLLNLRFRVSDHNYVEEDTEPKFNESVSGRRMQHLIRLRRLATLIDQLPRTDMDAIRQYESALDDYAFYLEGMDEEPENYPAEELPDYPEAPVLEDVRAAYYSLFPDSNERMRQRDFRALNEAGYELYYSHKYRVFIFDDSWY